MARWEYIFIRSPWASTFTYLTPSGPQEIPFRSAGALSGNFHVTVATLGQEGWEMVSAVAFGGNGGTELYFKRSLDG